MPDQFLALLEECYKGQTVGEFFTSHDFREIVFTKLQLSSNMHNNNNNNNTATSI